MRCIVAGTPPFVVTCRTMNSREVVVVGRALPATNWYEPTGIWGLRTRSMAREANQVAERKSLTSTGSINGDPFEPTFDRFAMGYGPSHGQKMCALLYRSRHDITAKVLRNHRPS